MRYGGNTSCVEVRCGSKRLIFDLGTGSRELGLQLLKNGSSEAHIFLTHTHLDHINGFPFFKPAYYSANRFELWNGHLRRQGWTLEAVLSTIMQKPLFPVPLNVMHAAIAFHDFDAGEELTPFDDIRLRTAKLNHPGGATGYRIDYRGRSFAFVTDTEHVPGKPDRNILALIDGCDVVVYDSTYTDAMFERYEGWGHSTWQEGVRLCNEASAKRLVTFHHDPNHNDVALDDIARQLETMRPGSIVARQGMELTL
ncbi:MAG: MBL fold metallo-hydrolase [Geminicoccaceae bacterium]